MFRLQKSARMSSRFTPTSVGNILTLWAIALDSGRLGQEKSFKVLNDLVGRTGGFDRESLLGVIVVD
jgi:hypothetical protein